MKTLLRIWFLLLAFGPLIANAQAPGASFSCDGTFYQVRQIATGTSITSALYVVDRSTNSYTTTAYTFGGTSTTGNLGVVVNALAYNPLDSYLYALAYPADNGTPPSSINLYRIGQGGIQNLGATNLPSAQYNSGTIDKQGNYYITTRGSGNVLTSTLFRLNLTNFATVLTSSNQYPLVNSTGASVVGGYTDIALDPTDNALYGVDLAGNLAKIVVTTTNGATRGVVTVIRDNSTSEDIFGSSFFDVAGNLYAYSNSGGIFLINKISGVATNIGTASSAPNSDGASCINPSQQIDVVKEVTGVTFASSGTGGNTVRNYDVAFAVRVKNTGTSTATNVQVTDFLNTTFPAATNFSYSILTAPAVTNIGINEAAAPTLVANATFTGSNTAANLLTNNQSLTAGQSALLTFTVRLRYASNTTPPATLYQNTAYASSTSGTGNNGYQISGGATVPPGNLLASDESTDGAGFPAVANDDTPTPTPVYLNTTIAGTVFEDYNYGGGAGRSQATSGGAGAAGARVELFNNTTNAFIATTTTDASGNYAFTSNLAGNTNYKVRVVNSSVRSTRPGSTADLLGVQTFTSNGVDAVTDQVGGVQPNEADYGNITTGTLPLSVTSATQEIQTVITVRTPASGPRLGVDAGFNFSTIVNTNDAGQGSLRQFILNSNALTNAGLDQAPFNGTVATGTTGTDPAAGVETSIFMLSDGRLTGAPAGLRNALPAATGYNVTTGFTFTTASALPTISDSNTALDGNKQANLTGNKIAAVAEETTGPEVTINFGGVAGLVATGGNTLVASVGLRGADGGTNQGGAGLTFNTSTAAGSIVRDVTATGNNRTGIRIEGGVNNVSVLNNVLNGNTNSAGDPDADGLELLGTTNATVTGNVINGNRGYGIFMTTAANTGATIANNIIRNNGTGSSTADAGISIGAASANNVFRQNIITGNAGDGIVALSGATGNLFTQNSFASNGDLGIDLSATTNNLGDGTNLNATGKATSAGANGLLNFPVISQAAVTNATTGNLVISGYAPANSTIELFVADRTTSAFGQGQVYLLSLTEGGTLNGIIDADNRTSNYSGTFNGLNHGSETNASRFYYTIPLTALTAAQRTALTASGARLTATATTATTNGTTTSEFSGNLTIRQNSPLPVTLTSFKAQAAGQNAQLTWTTAQEVNNNYFVVERSFDGQQFTAVQQVKGQGTTTAATSYTALDARVAATAQGRLVYYRLRQIDTDGTATLSTVQTISFLAPTPTARVYPNPVTPQQDARLDLTAAPAGSYQVTISDLTGRTVLRVQQAGGTEQTLNLGSLPGGVYLVQVQGNGQTITERLIKE